MLLLLLLFETQSTFAAQASDSSKAKKNLASYATFMKSFIPFITIGGNGSLPIGKSKSQFNVPNSGGINADIYVPFVRKGIVSFGINASGNYALSSKNPFSKLSVNPFRIINETSTTVTTTTSGSKKNQSFQFAAGPQINIHIGKHFVVSPIFNVGYMSYVQNDFRAIQTTNVNGSTYNINLLTQTQTSASGLLLAPKLRFHYFINDWIGLWIDGAFNYSNSMKSTITKFTPSGPANNEGFYDEAVIIEGSENTETIKNNFNAVGISGGLVFVIKGKEKVKPLPPINVVSNNQIDSQTRNCESRFIFDTVECIGNNIHFRVRSNWVLANVNNILSLKVFDDQGIQIPVSITNNNQTLGNTSSSRTLDFSLSNSYANRMIHVTQIICKNPDAPDEDCCFFRDSIRAKDCRNCFNCDGVSIVPSPSPTGLINPSSLMIAAVSGQIISSPALPIKKVVAQLETITVKNRTGQSIVAPAPNFEFDLGSHMESNITTSSPVLFPFSIAGKRSNIAESNFAPGSTVYYVLSVDNMQHKEVKSFRIKFTIFFTDGTYCEKNVQYPQN